MKEKENQSDKKKYHLKTRNEEIIRDTENTVNTVVGQQRIKELLIALWADMHGVAANQVERIKK